MIGALHAAGSAPLAIRIPKKIRRRFQKVILKSANRKTDRVPSLVPAEDDLAGPVYDAAEFYDVGVAKLRKLFGSLLGAVGP